MNTSLSLPNETSSGNKWYLLLFVNITLTLAAIFCGQHDILPFVNVYIPDSGAYEWRVFFPPSGNSLSNGFTYLNTFLYQIGIQSILLYNVTIMTLSVYFCSLFKVISTRSVTMAKIAVVFNPYLLISLTGPTKELNLVFFSLFAFYLFFKNSYVLKILAFIPACMAMGIRPQFGFVLLAGLVCYLLVRIIKNPITICIFILLMFLVVNTIPAVNTVITNSGGEELEYYRTSNYFAIALVLRELQQNPFLQIFALLAKSVFSMFAPIARPNSLMSPYIPLLEWGYTYMGWLMFPLNISFVLLFFNKKRTTIPKLNFYGQLIIVYSFLGILSVIISPIFNARYLFPYAPFIASCFIINPIPVRNKILVFSLIMSILAFIFSAIFLPVSFPADIDKAPFQFISWI